ncbi:Predicted nuclease of the RNAse H fold, HicB family [Pilibacter termitis]|jgi:predicted RNase H-like HicB family nuclease|uniref:Predicted nuclease of the RNAse H fold, HicB family n=1 Tax=Pilibacter termitis TaxID=263852 RepID=A0A1T4KWF1_9ENTE|nr:type II toxin-antitoxin system HicB family antitoxin [Pilibacter termitis]SJZ46637.1 Predicted nuclease of the RNAse H fold, HicB family [Pilibacter termitis]
MLKIYPAVFEKDPVGLGVYFPDLDDSATQGANIEEALENASDLLGIQLAWNVENNIPLPTPSEVSEIKIDPATQFVSLVSVNLTDYLQDTKADKKTIKIPHWLNVRATKAGINFSQTTTEALMDKLGV